MTAPLLLSRSEIDDRRWNELIANSGQQVIYGYTTYLDLVCDNWKALVWPAADEYRIVMPLPVKRKWLKEVVQQPLFCQYLGLFSTQAITAMELTLFLRGLSHYFSYISSYHFNPDNSLIVREILPDFPNLIAEENQTHWLSLENAYNKIRDHYSVDRKVNLKRSSAVDWVVQKCDNPQTLIDLFQKHHAAKIPGGVNSSAYALLRQLVQSLKMNNACELWYAVSDGQIHAGAIFARSAGKIIYLFNASDQVGRDGNARTFLLDQFFRENAGESIIFDFESPEIASIAAFYKSFGAVKTSYYVIKKNNLPFPFRQIQNWRVRYLLNTIPAPSGDF
ncbi:GNAT family N-acetyltransferase [Dyadobacter sp. LHD-138]|uniref:GNAT family N-acetyltransferase n=1 Tax=Dyadobacter sp. LHD-138 TaxID=3071413 RepID=UPI0027E0DCDC|nr:GNAT family N-acetyltransferase [Dyadobacter sp. LHD-138]MDQ6478027.1 GNAT family N-acetyltransferase [Dyadobacter sp. LHD-138]